MPTADTGCDEANEATESRGPTFDVTGDRSAKRGGNRRADHQADAERVKSDAPEFMGPNV